MATVRYTWRTNILVNVRWNKFFCDTQRSNVRAVDRLWITSPFLTMGMWGLTRNKEEDDKLVARQVLIAKADALFDQGDYKSIYDLLSSYEVIRSLNQVALYAHELKIPHIAISHLARRTARTLKSCGVCAEPCTGCRKPPATRRHASWFFVDTTCCASLLIFKKPTTPYTSGCLCFSTARAPWKARRHIWRNCTTSKSIC